MVDARRAGAAISVGEAAVVGSANCPCRGTKSSLQVRDAGRGSEEGPGEVPEKSRLRRVAVPLVATKVVDRCPQIIGRSTVARSSEQQSAADARGELAKVLPREPAMKAATATRSAVARMGGHEEDEHKYVNQQTQRFPPKAASEHHCVASPIRRVVNTLPSAIAQPGP
jgi:hypothetical protein